MVELGKRFKFTASGTGNTLVYTAESIMIHNVGVSGLFYVVMWEGHGELYHLVYSAIDLRERIDSGVYKVVAENE